MEAVLEAEEGLGGGVDLRREPTSNAEPLFLAWPVWPSGPSLLVMPGEAGKSTIARAIGVSINAGVEIIPGIRPTRTGPVLYVAAEDPAAFWHARNVEAICRGAGLDRRSIAHGVLLFDARGRALHRIARSIAERAADYAAVILDSHQALLQSSEQGGVRDRDSLFWNALDQIGKPTLILAHPNRADRQRWEKADGSMAGSDVNRDRARMSWRGRWRDEPAVPGTSFRRYGLDCTKFSHGPRPAPFSFAAGGEFGRDDSDPGVLTFSPSAAPEDEQGGLTAVAASRASRR